MNQRNNKSNSLNFFKRSTKLFLVLKNRESMNGCILLSFVVLHFFILKCLFGPTYLPCPSILLLTKNNNCQFSGEIFNLLFYFLKHYKYNYFKVWIEKPSMRSPCVVIFIFCRELRVLLLFA